MTYYPVPAANDTIGFYEYFGYVNKVAEWIFFPAMIFVVWIISFLAMKQYSSSRAWTFASFFCSILSIILAVLDYISPKLMYVFIIFFCIGMVWLKLEAE